MSMKTIIISLLTFIIVLFGTAFLIFNNEKNTQAKKEPMTDKAIAVVNSNVYNWGEIPLRGKEVTASFKIQNQGSKVLELSDVQTSCACTTAYLEKNNQKSPLFGMHTKSSYTMKLKPKEKAILHVIFDPDYHGPNGIGPITRIVTIKTNDIKNPELEFTLTAIVRN